MYNMQGDNTKNLSKHNYDYFDFYFRYTDIQVDL